MNNDFLKGLPDEELVQTAKKLPAEKAATLELLRRVSPFILLKSRQFGQTEQDKQDFYQEGVVGFLSAVHTFKPDSGAKFTTYACTCILNRMRNLIKQRSKSGNYRFIPLDSESEIEDTCPDPQQLIQAADEAASIYAVIENDLSQFEQQVIRLYLSGSSYSEIAAKTGKNAKAVDNAMQRIRRKLSPIRR